MLWVYDPGQTTGYAKFDDTGFLCDWGEFHLWREVPRQVQPGDQVVFESITWRHPSFNPIGLEVIGVIKFIAETRGAKWEGQSPNRISGVSKWPIFNFKSLKSEHMKDAICHGIVKLGRDQVSLPDRFLRTRSP